MYSSALRIACLAVLARSASGASAIAGLVGQLKLAPTANDRLALLTDDQLVFDFNTPPSGVVTGAGGHTVEASSENFAAVVGNGVAMTIGTLGPCAINTPHTHPRATEINFSVNGTLRAGLLTENGARFIVNDLPPGTASVFPKGAIHFEMNTGCETALFVAAFNDEDPGVLSVAQRYFGLPADIVGAALGGLGVEEVAGLEALIPDNVAAGTDECLARCGLKRPVQPTLQHQPVVPGNANPSSTAFSGTPAAFTSTTWSSSSSSTPTTAPTTAPTSTPTSTLSSTASSSATGSSGTKDISNLAASGGIANDTTSSSGTSPILIALVVINGLLVVGILAAAFMYVRGRSRRSILDPHKYQPTSTEQKTERYDPGVEREGGYYDPYTPTKPQFKDHQ